MKPIWRDSTASKEIATAGSVIIHATSELRREGLHTMVVHHVRDAHGKGFMPTVYCGAAPHETGKVFYLEDKGEPIAFMHAVTRGRRMFDRAVERAGGLVEENDDE